jgi:hypothetical protein
MTRLFVLSRRGVGTAIIVAVSSVAVTSVAYGQFGTVPRVGPTTPNLPTAPFHIPRDRGPVRVDSFNSGFRATAPRYDATARTQRSYVGSRTNVSRSEPARSARGWFGERRWRTRR